MRIVETIVYPFDELSKEAQKQVIESLSDINVKHSWWMDEYYDAEQIGLKITGFRLGRDGYISGEFLLHSLEVAANIIRDHGEHCDTYKTAESFLEEHSPIYSEYLNETSEHYESSEKEAELMALENKFLTDILDDYSVMLQKQYEFLMTDEAIIETIHCNNYEFTEDGKLFT